ncbi:30S ribosomal protein S9 [Sandaracinus amylolyticus]|uniref:Small ribosomal subunit protein uS9 n=1 Tax=Sandaracinus amylolyticus TaxID=927083 RepID=A0A0F6YHQ3_9BACT|nr:30S ribosomal protein S9 [Sandaracinus amylolyticus]AKF05960.1 SSU ribosomal protein S9p [Sandaracinus amylolyticus]
MPQALIHGRHYGTGKRKRAIARVFLKPGSGDITVNGRTLAEYFPRETSQMIARQAFEIIEKMSDYDVTATVCGGGVAAQAEAVRHGISRALLHVDGELRSPLKKAGLLTRDAREKERKKPGQPGARKKFQFSKR